MHRAPEDIGQNHADVWCVVAFALRWAALPFSLPREVESPAAWESEMRSGTYTCWPVPTNVAVSGGGGGYYPLLSLGVLGELVLSLSFPSYSFPFLCVFFVFFLCFG